MWIRAQHGWFALFWLCRLSDWAWPRQSGHCQTQRAQTFVHGLQWFDVTRSAKELRRIQNKANQPSAKLG